MKAEKSTVIKKILLIILQALSVAVLGVAVVFYIISARGFIASKGVSDDSHFISSIGELRADYYESELYSQNIHNTLTDIASLVSIREQLETGDSFDGTKLINIGEYAYRDKKNSYNGPAVYYELDDLLLWAQSGFNHYYNTFDSFEQMEEYFSSNVAFVIKESSDEVDDEVDSKNSSSVNKSSSSVKEDKSETNTKEDKTSNNDKEDNNTSASKESKNQEESYTQTSSKPVNTTEDDDKGNQVPTLDMLKEAYLTSDGKNLSDYAKSSEEYTLLCQVLEITANSLYERYKDYLALRDFYSPDYSNIKYFVAFGSGKNKRVYSNLPNGRIITDEMLSETFKDLGEYVYVDLTQFDFLTNMPITYEEIKNAFLGYANANNGETTIWIGLDTSYPVNDIYYRNYNSNSKAVGILPWVISGAAISIILFVAFLIVITGMEIRVYSGAKTKLGDFDRLPIEVETLFYLLIGSIIFISFKIVMTDTSIWNITKAVTYVIPVNVFVFLSTLVILLYYYAIVRRISAENFWEKSFFAWMFRAVFLRNNRLKRLFWKIYDESGVAIRTWGTYLFFLVYNTFWACMLFFSKHPVISALCLLIFDLLAGLYLFGKNVDQKRIVDGIRRINTGDYDYQIDCRKMHGDTKSFAEAVNDIGLGLKTAVETSTRDEKLKADLITNVSHDIKTPLTSIINYVDLIKRENIDNEKVKEYVRVLDEKSQRLKQLTMDLVEASKAASGNITLELYKINFIELLNQTVGEFEEKYDSRGLCLVKSFPSKPVYIMADPRRMFRIIENLFTNVYKYALENTRVYLDLEIDEKAGTMAMHLKNVSSNQLNFSADELTQRFIRGDVARSTEGSGLGLSIAKSLTLAHGGVFDIYLDGDLFKATLIFNLADENAENTIE